MSEAFVGRCSPIGFAATAEYGAFAVLGKARELTRHEPSLHLEVLHLAGAGEDSACGNGLICGNVTNLEHLARERARRKPEEPPLSDPLDLVRALYEEYGAPAFRLLEGLFAGFMLSQGRLVLFASKTPGPTLYFNFDATAKTVWFATELKAFPRKLRRTRPFMDLMHESTRERSRNTCLHDVFRVRSGYVVELATLGSTGVREVPYYSTHRSIVALTEDEAAERVRSVVEAAVQGVPGSTANCLVSGGLDSSIVAAIALERFDRVKLFSLGSRERNEFDAASVFTNRFGLTFERLLIEQEDFLHALPELVYLVEHCHSTFVEYLLPVHLAHRRIGNTADVVLSGYGSDVLFAGFARATDSLAHVVRLVEEEYASTQWSNEASQTLGGCMGMTIGYPFFHSAVVDTSFSIDPYLKHKNGVEKYILRRAFSKVLGPDVAFRPKLGVHHGTGSEDYLSSLFGPQHGEALRRLKDRLCYDVLCTFLTEGARPSDIDVRALIAAASDRKNASESEHRLQVPRNEA